MLSDNNLKSFFVGGTKNRERRETRQAWEETQRLWRASPLAQAELSEFTTSLVRDAMQRADRAPALPVCVAVAEAVEALYRNEEIGDFEAKWEVIESDVQVAMEFRQMMTRRRRWAADFDVVHAAFYRIVLANIDSFFKALPECCFGDWDAKHSDTFEVPLIDLLDDPATVIERLFLLPYDDDSFRLDIFWKFRDHCGSRLLIASGFLPTDNIRERGPKLLLPSKQTDKTGAELAELYLGGSPLKALLDLPVPFHIPEELRFEHCHIVGGTGHGKTQLMQKMIHSDFVAAQHEQRSVVVIDSQGDLISKLIRLELFSPDAPDSLADRLVVVDPSDVEFPAALNLFDAHLHRVREYSAANRERVLNGVIELYEMFFGAFLGAELTQKQGVIFKYLARLMLAIPDATIYTFMQIMEDGKPYKQYMDLLDGSARYFFETEFFHPSFAATKKQILRRLWGVLSTPAFERMFTQPKNKLDLYEAMNDGKIILVSTAKDLLKREGSQLLGRFFIAMIMQAALERSTLPEHRRMPAFVYVDEAQEYFDDSIETILNQARKYHVGLTLAHQTLDQLSPRLRSAILANTSMKCAGGVSAKDARALADELHTTSEFIESMKRRGPRTEFATSVKHLTGQAIRLSVPLGFLERQPVLAEEDYDALIKANRERYCGTLADVAIPMRPSVLAPDNKSAVSPQRNEEKRTKAQAAEIHEPRRSEPPPSVALSEPVTERSTEYKTASLEHPPIEQHELGKGGPKHRYLQSLVKELGEQQGFRAVTEAALEHGLGQVDVLLQRDGLAIAVEISVTTPVDQERENVRKCLDAGYPRVALVLVKSKNVQTRYQSVILESLNEDERRRVSFLTPEEIPDYLAGFAAPRPEESVVRGYKVRLSHTAVTPEEAKDRRERIAKVIAKSLQDKRA